MQAPKFKWELNPNTLVVLVGFAAGFVAWGYTLNDLRSGRALNADNISRLEARVATIEAVGRVLDNHELRISNVEVSSRDAAAAMRAVEASLNNLSSDVRMTREIMERLERSQGTKGSR